MKEYEAGIWTTDDVARIVEAAKASTSLLKMQTPERLEAQNRISSTCAFGRRALCEPLYHVAQRAHVYSECFAAVRLSMRVRRWVSASFVTSLQAADLDETWHITRDANAAVLTLDTLPI